MKKLIMWMLALFLGLIPVCGSAGIKGIYLSQLTAEDSAKVAYLIKNAKAVGIGTFVVDYERPNKVYTQNIALIKQNGLRYVARVVIFPGGATPSQAASSEYLARRLQRVKEAIALGANEIQLDYIRYKASQPPSPKNAQRIAAIIRYFKTNVAASGVPLQVDVFGISTFKPSVYIGQNLQLFAQEVDAINPMVYPSHYEPFRIHARQPYKTVFESINALKKQISPSDIKVYAYIELFNYRYPMSEAQRQDYIRAELKAVKDSGADGWYAWSAGNRYDILFNVLRQAQLAEN